MAGRVIPAYNATHIAAQTAGTLVRTGPGVLHGITFNKPVATAVITVYDGLTTGGAVLAIITTPASPQPGSLFYDIAFATGLFIVLATADCDLTVTWAPG